MDAINAAFRVGYRFWNTSEMHFEYPGTAGEKTLFLYEAPLSPFLPWFMYVPLT